MSWWPNGRRILLGEVGGSYDGCTAHGQPGGERSRGAALALGIALVTFGVVVKLADSVRESDAVTRTDRNIANFLIDHRTTALTSLARVVTQLGSGWIVGPLVFVVVIVLMRSEDRRSAAILVVDTAGAAALVEIIKHLVGRPRPPIAEKLISAHGLAFPSGHAAQSVACFATLAWLIWPRGGWARVVACIAAVCVALLVGTSRVYLGVHWPSDILGGWLLAAGWIIVVNAALRPQPTTSASRTQRPA